MFQIDIEELDESEDNKISKKKKKLSGNFVHSVIMFVIFLL